MACHGFQCWDFGYVPLVAPHRHFYYFLLPLDGPLDWQIGSSFIYSGYMFLKGIRGGKGVGVFINWVERVQGEGLPLEGMGVVEGVGKQVVE